MLHSLFASPSYRLATLALALAILVGAGMVSAEARPGVRVKILDMSRVMTPYKRPVQTTLPQRAAQQGKPCVTCGATAPRMHADHKEPLIRQHHHRGVDVPGAKRLDAVQPQCPTCSARQGGTLRAERQRMQKDHRANEARVSLGCPGLTWVKNGGKC